MNKNVEFPTWNRRSHFISVWKVAEKYDELIEDYGLLPSKVLGGGINLEEVQQFLPRMKEVLGPNHEFTFALRAEEAFGIVLGDPWSDEGWTKLENTYLDSCDALGALNQVTNKIVDRIVEMDYFSHSDAHFIPLYL